MSVAATPKAFGFDEQMSYFSHLFNCPANYGWRHTGRLVLFATSNKTIGGQRTPSVTSTTAECHLQTILTPRNTATPCSLLDR
jgi:hypothetical protein